MLTFRTLRPLAFVLALAAPLASACLGNLSRTDAYAPSASLPFPARDSAAARSNIICGKSPDSAPFSIAFSSLAAATHPRTLSHHDVGAG